MADSTIYTLISQEDVEKRVKEIGEQISKEYEGKDLHMVGILKGSVYYMVELAKHITCPMTMDFMSVSSYENATSSSGVVRLIDSGRTLSYLLELLSKRNPASLKLTTLLDKPDRRVVQGVDVDYVGFVIPDEFVIGYGLDFEQHYRNLPYIGYFKQEESGE